MKKFLLFILTFSLTLAACTQTSEGWVGFYYPSGSVGDGVEIQEFDLEASCTEWAENLIKEAKQSDAHYFCGFDCNYDKTGQYSCT